MKISTLKKVFVGRPLATAQARHERLSKGSALAVFASDALSSVAYATEEILLILVLAGTAALGYAIPIGVAICLLIAVVTSSYRQTILAYPQGGGAYIVTKDNLGTLPSLVAGAALLVDYVLTVAVSVAAGIAALTSAFPALYDYRVLLGVLCIAAIATANLRGIRESGALFALPTYLFIASFLGMLGYGYVRWLFGWELPPPPERVPAGAHAVTTFFLLRAFAQGCTALTGVEAVSDGVPAFKPPEAKNARIVLAWLGVILVTLFMGITFLARHYHLTPIPAGDRRLPARPPDLRGRPSLLRDPGGDDAHPDPRRQYVVRGLPEAVVLSRPRRVHPAAVRHPGRPARLLQRHPHPRRHRRRARHRVRRRDACADPALRARRLHLVHPLPGQHGPALARAPRGGLVVALVAERGGRGDHGRRHARDRRRPSSPTARGSSCC